MHKDQDIDFGKLKHWSNKGKIKSNRSLTDDFVIFSAQAFYAFKLIAKGLLRVITKKNSSIYKSRLGNIKRNLQGEETIAVMENNKITEG